MFTIKKIALLILIVGVHADIDEMVADHLDADLITKGLMDGKPCTKND